MSRPAAPAIEVRALRHAFGGERRVPALDGATLEVPGGAFASVIGRSGCGKSTLLRVLAGVLVPDEGSARIAGHDVLGHPGSAAFMPQRDTLLPWRRVLGNAVLGAELRGLPAAESEVRARSLFPRFGLEGFERAWPAELSGGMRQRLALLRTFLTPGVLLLDEPFGALDALTRREMQLWLQGVWRETSAAAVLLVTHDIDEALLLSDLVYVMSDRPGRVVARVEVPLRRPRISQDVTTPVFAELKARVLGALDGGGGRS
ncbi:MAG: ABC transporter ATP-binding protein [Dehalococcoidia bacterium]|nr:ABC transporter ATP-binding protein [Dehalococcoidia bacterium]